MDEIRSPHDTFQTRVAEIIMRQRKIKNNENDKTKNTTLN
jgi:hypothetical protein